MASVQRTGGFFAGLIFGVIFSVVGFCVVYFLGLPMLREAKASSSWPTSDGVVTVARVESKRERRDGKTRTMYSHHIEYRYTVDGQELTGDRVWTSDGGTSSSSSSFAKNTVANYPVGKEVKVHYDPAAPAVCVLEPGTTWVTYLPLILGGVFFLVGMMVLAAVVFKILAAVFFVGAAATAYATSGNSSTTGTSGPPIDASGDDGISIGE
jgi:hypothetical protein